MKGRFISKKHSTRFLVAHVTLSLTLNPVFGKSSRFRTVLTVLMGWMFGEVRDVRAYVTGLEVCSMGRCLFLGRIKYLEGCHLLSGGGGQ